MSDESLKSISLHREWVNRWTVHWLFFIDSPPFRWPIDSSLTWSLVVEIWWESLPSGHHVPGETSVMISAISLYTLKHCDVAWTDAIEGWDMPWSDWKKSPRAWGINLKDVTNDIEIGVYNRRVFCFTPMVSRHFTHSAVFSCVFLSDFLWLVVWNINFIFPSIRNVIIPTD